MPSPTAALPPTANVSGSLAAAISDAVVALMVDYTGRGPNAVRTTIGDETIVVTLRGCLTKAETTLARRGQALEVLAMRRAFQSEMRQELCDAVESLTGRPVAAFLSDNLYDPDVAVEVFLMGSSDNGSQLTDASPST